MSLGLVGALSIVRFRSAIKEPEELVFLFLAISAGLGFGADQATLTFTIILLILLFAVVAMPRLGKNAEINKLFLYIDWEGDSLRIKEIMRSLESNDPNIRVEIFRISNSEGSNKSTIIFTSKHIDGLNARLNELISSLSKMEFPVKFEFSKPIEG